MLNKDAKINIKNIENAAKKVWGGNVEFGELLVIDSPYPTFEWYLKLYDTVDIKIEYEVSTMATMIKMPNGYIEIGDLVGKPVILGFESCLPENLLHNFNVVDEFVKKKFI